ncbi:putative PHP family metal-dependent phosphoesterase, partial [Candidatus Gastranaerophilus sp. (ex Termes propinquus)]
LDGAKEVVRAISENPVKYKNVKFVPGVEASVSHTKPEDTKAPLNFELVGYSLNPFNEKLNDFFKNTRESRILASKLFIDEVNAACPGLDAKWEEAAGAWANVKKGTSDGSIWLAKDYAAGLEGADNNVLDELRNAWVLNSERAVSSGIVVTPERLFEAYRESGDRGMFGLAHPGCFPANHYSDEISDFCEKNPGTDKGLYQANRVLEHLHKSGGGLFKGCEVNYQSYGNNSGKHKWAENISNLAMKYATLKTGGMDCHGTSIFLKYQTIPDELMNLEIQEILGARQ